MFSAPPTIPKTPGFRNLSYVRSADLSGTTTDAGGFVLSRDGTKMIQGDDDSGGDIRNWSMSTAYDISTLSHVSSVAAAGSTPVPSAWNADGSKVFYHDGPGEVLYESTCASNYVYQNNDTDSQSTTAWHNGVWVGIQWLDSGTKAVICQGNNGNQLALATASTAYDITTLTLTSFDSCFPAKHYYGSIRVFTKDDIRWLFMSGKKGGTVGTLWVLSLEDAIANNDASLITIHDERKISEVDGSWPDSQQVSGDITEDGTRVYTLTNNGQRMSQFDWLQS